MANKIDLKFQTQIPSKRYIPVCTLALISTTSFLIFDFPFIILTLSETFTFPVYKHVKF